MKTAPWIIIAVLLLVIIAMRECSPTQNCAECDNQTIIHDTTIIQGDSIPVPYPVHHYDTIDSIVYRDIPAKVDTAAILADYFAQNFYLKRELVNDSDLLVRFDALVTENRLQFIRPYVQLKRRTIINHYTTVIEAEKPRNKYYAGLGLGRSLTSFGLAPSVALLNRKGNLYSIHYDVLHKEGYFTMYWKIR